MNAFEISKNIISDGIVQCQQPIWERLLIPDFNILEPQDIIANFNSPEEWLESELRNFVSSNQYFEKEYYASKSLMSEEEYNDTKFSYYFKRDYTPDYYEYKKRWQIDYYKLIDIERSRQEVKDLFDREFLEIKEFNALKLSDRTMSRFEDTINGRYGSYSEFWRKSRTEEGRYNILKSFEKWWSYDFQGSFTDNVFEFRQKANELKSNYL